MVELSITARCHPTEDPEKVARAIRNIFPDAEVVPGDPIVARSHSFENFVELLKRQRIRDAARAALRRGMIRGPPSFALNKQVAAVGKVSFAEESHALGDIEVTAASEDIQTLISVITPRPATEVMR